MQYFEWKQTVLSNLSPFGSWNRKIDTNPPAPLLYFYPFMDSLHHFMSIFSMCDRAQEFEIDVVTTLTS